MARIYGYLYYDSGSYGQQLSFDESEGLVSLIKRFEADSNRINKVENSKVKYMDRLVEKEDGTLKLDSEDRQIYERIYTNKEL